MHCFLLSILSYEIGWIGISMGHPERLSRFSNFRVDLKPSESSFENLKISEGSASTVENIKSYCFGSEVPLKR